MTFNEYRQSIGAAHSTGQATEHSYRAALATLLVGVGSDAVDALNEPSQQSYGAPDFVLQRRGVPIGHIECKDVGTNLDAVERSEQLARYLAALPNLLLTDYLEFRWFVRGERRGVARLGQLNNAGQLDFSPKFDSDLHQLLSSFFAAEEPSVGQAGELAERMAAMAKMLRVAIEKILDEDGENAPALTGLLESYRKVLINDLSVADFADLQAQTAAYGLFAARCLHSGPPAEFSRQSAVFADTTPFLRDVFGHIAGPSADSRIVWIIDDLALLLANADMASVLEGFGSATRKEDPIVHFYEDFLAAYDPKLRELRGVYYTPEPVVSYIVRSVDLLLRDRFAVRDGLADRTTVNVVDKDGSERALPRVVILDPAAGTGTFLREVMAQVRRDLAKRGVGGSWGVYAPKYLLPQLFGFELLMAAYTICHLKLTLELGEAGEKYTLSEGTRLGVFLTNTLSDAHEATGGPMFAPEIVREAREADAVKREHPVMVVIGNPPYSGHSANKGKWITDLMRGRILDDPQSYFSVDGEPLDERNPKWINDDYVKFIRFAQWRISQTGEGIVGFVTNHSYLDNPTFRGMRRSLMETFDEIWLLDLHGSAKKQEKAPGGGRDQNVFDIQQGVAISIFVKDGSSGEGLAKVYHADLWGERGDTESGKYAWLAEHDVKSTRWYELAAKAPDYFFVPRDDALQVEYESGWKLTDIAPIHSVGMVTARDKLAIQFSDEEMRRVANEFVGLSETDAREKYGLGEDSSDWTVAAAQDDLRTHPDAKAHIKTVLYRPFDKRTTYFTGMAGGFICRPRAEVMHHMLAGPNIGLISCRQQSQQGVWNLTGITDGMIESAAISNKTKQINYLFPLYLYPSGDDALNLGVASRVPNLAPEFIAAISAASGLEFVVNGAGDLVLTFGPEDVLHYIYAMLHSSWFRFRFADFLRSDFPRIPLPAYPAQFSILAQHGSRLAALHLLTADGEEMPVFGVGGSGVVETVRYVEPSSDTRGRVWFNQDQHFDGVSPEAWQFVIGGYQPAKKWLEDRTGRTLSFDDILAYQQICAALGETPQVVAKIDAAVETSAV